MTTTTLPIRPAQPCSSTRQSSRLSASSSTSNATFSSTMSLESDFEPQHPFVFSRDVRDRIHSGFITEIPFPPLEIGRSLLLECPSDVVDWLACHHTNHQFHVWTKQSDVKWSCLPRNAKIEVCDWENGPWGVSGVYDFVSVATLDVHDWKHLYAQAYQALRPAGRLQIRGFCPPQTPTFFSRSFLPCTMFLVNWISDKLSEQGIELFTPTNQCTDLVNVGFVEVISNSHIRPLFSMVHRAQTAGLRLEHAGDFWLNGFLRPAIKTLLDDSSNAMIYLVRLTNESHPLCLYVGPP